MRTTRLTNLTKRIPSFTFCFVCTLPRRRSRSRSLRRAPALRLSERGARRAIGDGRRSMLTS